MFDFWTHFLYRSFVGYVTEPEASVPEPLPPIHIPRKQPEPDHLSNVADDIVDAERATQDIGWTGKALAEPKNPSDHLMQQVISDIRKVEGCFVAKLSFSLPFLLFCLSLAYLFLNVFLLPPPSPPLVLTSHGSGCNGPWSKIELCA